MHLVSARVASKAKRLLLASPTRLRLRLLLLLLLLLLHTLASMGAVESSCTTAQKPEAA